MYIYSDPRRENEEHAPPDVEVFYADALLCEKWGHDETAPRTANRGGTTPMVFPAVSLMVTQ